MAGISIERWDIAERKPGRGDPKVVRKLGRRARPLGENSREWRSARIKTRHFCARVPPVAADSRRLNPASGMV